MSTRSICEQWVSWVPAASKCEPVRKLFERQQLEERGVRGEETSRFLPHAFLPTFQRRLPTTVSTLKSSLLIYLSEGKNQNKRKNFSSSQDLDKKIKTKKTAVGKVSKHHRRTVGRISALATEKKVGAVVDPILLPLFLKMSSAPQIGVVDRRLKEHCVQAVISPLRLPGLFRTACEI